MLHWLLPLCCCCPVQMIARLGRWLRTALNTSYLKFFKPKGLLAAGQWDKDRPAAFFDERFCLNVAEELVLLVFPWLTELRNQVRISQGLCTSAGVSAPFFLKHINMLMLRHAQGSYPGC